MERIQLVEKNNHLAVHGLFYSRESAKSVCERSPDIFAKGYFTDKTLTANDFIIIDATPDAITQDGGNSNMHSDLSVFVNRAITSSTAKTRKRLPQISTRIQRRCIVPPFTIMAEAFQELKWYDHIRDMQDFSTLYPEHVFVLHGVGEDNEEWQAYFYHRGYL